MLTLDRVYQAAHVLKSVVRETDLIPSPGLFPGCELVLKPENLQNTGSFKIRGAYFKISSLTDAEKSRGVVACSAGNHAQGVALAAKKAGIRSTIFIPSVAPLSKIEATKRLGAEIKIVDGVYDDAYDEAVRHIENDGGVLIHPFDDEDIIAGQGTIGLEILEEMPDVEAVVVPVGGGGLAAGIAFTIKKLKPECRVYGAEAAGAGSMYASRAAGERESLTEISTFADGIAVRSPGELTFRLCEDYLDGVVTVTDDEIATAILALMEQQKLVSEGAGAVAVAALMFGKLPLCGKKTCAVVSGGNIDVNILSRVITRGLMTTGRFSQLKIALLDKPGQLREVSGIIAEYGANVIKVRHDPGGEETDITGCYLHISLETRNKEHFSEICQALKNKGYQLL